MTAKGKAWYYDTLSNLTETVKIFLKGGEKICALFAEKLITELSKMKVANMVYLRR